MLLTIAKPELYPVKIEDARAQCSIVDDLHDTSLLRMIAAATGSVEDMTGARLMPQTVELVCSEFLPALDLGVYPVQSITSVTYIDTSGQTQTLDPATYRANINGLYPCVQTITEWPAVEAGNPAPIKVRMQVGYAQQDDVPEAIRQAILIRVAEMFAVRGESIQGTVTDDASLTVRMLVNPHRRLKL